MHDAPDDELTPPRPGDTCAVHPERRAVLLCPRCARPACFTCWQPAQRRCHTCVMAYPAEVAPTIPWETEGVSFGRGVVGTLRQAFSPTTAAPALGHGDVRGALGFALLTWLPLAALQGVIPYTRTLSFGERHLAVAEGSAPMVVALDIARAMSLGIVLGAIQLAGMGLAFASLGNAYGHPDVQTRAAAWRTVFFRAFIVLLLPSLMHGGLVPSDLVANVMLFGGLFEPTLYVLVAVSGGVWLLTTLRTSARLAMGMGPSMSFLVPFIVLAVGVLSRLLMETALQPLMPPPPDPSALRAPEADPSAPAAQPPAASPDPSDPSQDAPGSEGGPTTPDPDGAEPASPAPDQPPEHAPAPSEDPGATAFTRIIPSAARSAGGAGPRPVAVSRGALGRS